MSRNIWLLVAYVFLSVAIGLGVGIERGVGLGTAYAMGCFGALLFVGILTSSKEEKEEESDG